MIVIVLQDILTVLQSDTQLQSLLGGTVKDKKIYAFTASKLNSICYNYTELTSNKITGQSRLELTINTLQADLMLNIQIVDRVKQLLLTLASEQFNDTILKIEQNGGGVMTNDELRSLHTKIFFTIKYKEGNK